MLQYIGSHASIVPTMLPCILTCVDVETTGISPSRGKIIEIGILRIEDGVVTNTFQTLVNPETYIPPEITLLTGITSEQLENAPTFRTIKDTIRELFSDSIFVAHNAKFDYAFIREEFKREQESFRAKILCTAKLSRRLYPQFRRHNLDSIIERFNIPCTSRHRAFDDAKVLWDFLQHTTSAVQTGLFTAALENVTRTAALPPGLRQQDIDTLPEDAGVYIFYNADHVPIYIGKSIHIRERVLSHFADMSRSTKEAKIFSSIASVETFTTEGELGALLLESQLIKEYQPIYNSLLRKTRELHFIYQSQTTDGYYTIEKKTVTTDNLPPPHNILGVFRSTRHQESLLRELAETHALCLKLLGLERTKGRCFANHLGTCAGACIGKELPAKYNMRFIQAFAKTKVREWPFPGPISITEGNTTHIVSNWCYIGQQSFDSQDTYIPGREQFDYDTYKIFARYLLSEKHKRVSLLSNSQ